jgi:hypothetical protein
MSKITYRLVFSIGFLLSIYGSSAAYAAETAPLDLPPNLKTLDETTDQVVSPQNTPQKPGATEQHTTTKTVQSGTSTKVIVNTGSSTYTVQPNQTGGNVTPGEVQSSSNHPALWNIFSWGKAKPAEPAENIPLPPDAPQKPAESNR